MRPGDLIKSRLLTADGDWPAYLRYWYRVTTGTLQPLLYQGDSHECPVCRQRVRAFADWRHAGEMYPAARCVRCNSLPRHRVLWLFLEWETDLLSRPIRVLHISPDFGTYRRLSRMPAVDYVTGDVQRSPMIRCRLDVTSIPFGDDSFDLVLCSHVLEHVPDDQAAMRELRRVVKPAGLALLQHPVADIPVTDEDPAVVDPAERLRRWGQTDHVRSYGHDYPDRLRAAGFDVDFRAYHEELAQSDVVRYGLQETDRIRGQDIAACRPSPAPATSAAPGPATSAAPGPATPAAPTTPPASDPAQAAATPRRTGRET